MKREIVELPHFSEKVKKLANDHKLRLEDFNTFKGVLAENPEMGDVIQGTGGVRKTRLKSASKGKSGGFRVCYYFHHVKTGIIYLMTIRRPLRLCEFWTQRDEAKSKRSGPNEDDHSRREGVRRGSIWQSRSQSKFTQPKRAPYIYPKNEKDDISPDEKKDLKMICDVIKKRR